MFSRKYEKELQVSKNSKVIITEDRKEKYKGIKIFCKAGKSLWKTLLYRVQSFSKKRCLCETVRIVKSSVLLSYEMPAITLKEKKKAK